MDTTTVVVAIFGSVGTILAATLPAIIAWRRARDTERRSVKRDDFNAAVVEWRRLYDEANARAARAEEHADRCEAELAEVQRRLNVLERRGDYT